MWSSHNGIKEITNLLLLRPPPKDDLITAEYLAQCDGHNPEFPIYVAIRGEVFDVSSNKDAYGPGKGYNVFCGKHSSKVGVYWDLIAYETCRR
jgi:Cytochrome b5-like Heme/Steroid binding domain